MLVLSRADVEALLDPAPLVDALSAAMADLSAGRASMPPRIAATVPGVGGFLAAMPAYLPASSALTTKLVSVFPANRDRPTHQALICCFDPVTGTPIAIMDGEYITAARTAAASALATRLLARPAARVVAIVGAGVQARAHARALSLDAPGRELRIASRDRAAASVLAASLEREGLPAQPMPSIEAAVRSADIVCLATHAAASVIRREWLRPGVHLNSVGYNVAGDGEIDFETLRDALLVVESRAAALAPLPAGVIELRRAIDRGLLTPAHIAAELGELVAGAYPGRTSDAQLTLYKSVGVAVEDAAAAALVLAAAQAAGAGAHVDI